MVDKKQVSPQLQKLTQQYIKAEQALLTVQSTLNMARDYMFVLKQGLATFIEKEQEEAKLQKVLQPKEVEPQT